MSRPAPFFFVAMSHLVGGSGGLRKGTARGRVRLERAPQAELLADLTDGRKHFLPEEANAAARVVGAHEAVIRPEPHDGRPRLFEEPANLRDHGLRRARDDLLVLDL